MPHPPERVCACGCGTRFACKGPAHRYAHPTHRPARAPHYTPDELRQRALLLKHPPQGDPCPRCGQPMWPDQKLDTGHITDRALGGTGHGFRWEHAHCGRSAGATMGNRLRLKQTAVQQHTATRYW